MLPAALPHPTRSRQRSVLIVPAWYGTPDDPVAGVFVREQARLVAARNEVVVLYPFQLGTPRHGIWEVCEYGEDAFPTLRVQRRRLPWVGHDFTQTVLGIRAAMARLRRRGFVPDVIHAHVFSAAAVTRAAVDRRIPMVVTEHASAIARSEVRGLTLLLARWAYARAQLIAPVSNNLATRIAELGVRTPVRVIPNAVDVERFRPPAPGERSRAPPERLLFVGGLVPVKGVHTALEAFAIVRARRPTARLEIVGDGPLRESCEAAVRTLGVGDAVTFLGRMDRDAVAQRMRASHVLVSASDWENLPGVQLEALASGLPIVATRVGGVPELVDDDRGRLVAPADPAALAEGIEDVLARHEMFDPHVLAARAREHFGPALVAELWDDVYARLADGGGVSEAPR